MKKMAVIVLAALLTLFSLVGCAQKELASETKVPIGEEIQGIMQEEQEEETEEHSEGRYILVEELYEYSDSTMHRKFTFDSNCKILEFQYEEVKGGESDTLSELYTYDADGNPGEALLLSNGEVSQKYLFECNETGQVEQMAIYNVDGEPVNLISYAYDKNGYQVERITYPGYPDLDHTKRSSWVYDEAGNLLQTENSDDGRTYERWEYTYDADNGLKEILRWTEYNRKEYWYAEVECDSDGHPMWMIWYNEDGEETGARYEFTYDTNGNKLKEWYYQDKQLVYMATFRYEKMETVARGIFGE